MCVCCVTCSEWTHRCVVDGMQHSIRMRDMEGVRVAVCGDGVHSSDVDSMKRDAHSGWISYCVISALLCVVGPRNAITSVLMLMCACSIVPGMHADEHMIHDTHHTPHSNNRCTLVGRSLDCFDIKCKNPPHDVEFFLLLRWRVSSSGISKSTASQQALPKWIRHASRNSTNRPPLMQ